MPEKIISELIRATRQERQRLEERKNRPRYFMFGKTDEAIDEGSYTAVFENVPERVLKDAEWGPRRKEPVLFKIGEVFVEGDMARAGIGVRVTIDASGLRYPRIDVAEIAAATEVGIDYVMDSRQLIDHLADFLEGRRLQPNPFIVPLIGKTAPCPMDPIPRAMPLNGLNRSQCSAIDKALRQKVTYVWGPPGTGKTKTMGALAASLVLGGKRVLLTALSNMALDQLLLATAVWFRQERDNIGIARLGRRMESRCERFGREAFQERLFGAKMAGMKWSDHVRRASLVAGNFALLTHPRTPPTGVFDFVIADEVSMANIPSLAAASCFAESAVVVGGDPFQLPPIFPEDAEEPNEWFKRNIFEIAEVKDPADPRAAFLDIQYRMQKEIGDLVSRLFYEGRLRTGSQHVNPLGGYGARVVFVHCPGRVEMVGERYIREEEQRRYNETHAQVAASIAHQAIKDGYSPANVGIIAPYNAQVVKIYQQLGKWGSWGGRDTGKLKVATVHSFQGQERRVIVLDITDDNIQPTPLTAKRELINVALSRAKEQLIIIGNREYLLDEEYFSYEEIEMFEKMLAAARILSIKKEPVS